MIVRTDNPNLHRQQAHLVDALGYCALAIAVLWASAALGQGLCQIDPWTGQVVCPNASAGGWAQPYQQKMPSLYGIPYFPEQPTPAWAEPRVVKLRNSVGPTEVAYTTGNIIAPGGDARYILSCGHGLGPAGDPVLVIFSDGVSKDIAEVVATDPANDLGLLKLKGAARAEYFEIADSEPPAGTPVRLGGFPNGGAYGGSNCTLQQYADVVDQNGRQLSVAICTPAAYQGMSGGYVWSPSEKKLVGILHSIDINRGETLCARLSRIRQFLARVFPQQQAAPPVATNNDWQPVTPPQVIAPPQAATPPPATLPATVAETPPAVTVPEAELVAYGNTDKSLVISEKVEHQEPASGFWSFVRDAAGWPWWKLAVYGIALGGGAWAPYVGWAGVKKIGLSLAGYFARRGARRLAAKAHDIVSGTAAAEAADQAATFPDDGLPSDTSDRVGLYRPIERDLTEGQQLLQLARLEGSDALQDAIAGRLTRNRLNEIADSLDPANDEMKPLAARLLREIDQRFNEIAPTNFKIAQGV